MCVCRRERGAPGVASQVGVPLPDWRQGGGRSGLPPDLREDGGRRLPHRPGLQPHSAGPLLHGPPAGHGQHRQGQGAHGAGSLIN